MMPILACLTSFLLALGVGQLVGCRVCPRPASAHRSHRTPKIYATAQTTGGDKPRTLLKTGF